MPDAAGDLLADEQLARVKREGTVPLGRAKQAQHDLEGGGVGRREAVGCQGRRYRRYRGHRRRQSVRWLCGSHQDVGGDVDIGRSRSSRHSCLLRTTATIRSRLARVCPASAIGLALSHRRRGTRAGTMLRASPSNRPGLDPRNFRCRRTFLFSFLFSTPP